MPKRTPPPEFDDTDLLARLCTSDAAAFEHLFRLYFAELVSFAQSYLHSRDAAEDVVQDVFARLWELRATIQLRSGIAQYLYSAVRHGALDTLKHDRVAARWESSAALTSPSHSATNEGAARVEADELAAVVARAVASLPPRCQDVFRLSRYRRLSQRDIAETLGITVNTVNVQLGRALRTIDAAVRAWDAEGDENR